FVRHVIPTNWIERRLDLLVTLQALVWIALIVWDQVWPSTISMQALSTAGAFTMALACALLWSAWRSGERWARWIAAGFLPMLVAGILPVLRNFDLVSSGFLSQYAMVLAAAIDAPLLIYGLVQRSSVQHEARARARALALTEPLTGLTNRHNCILRLHDALIRAQRYRHRCALLVINLGNHEWFTKEHGREIGDRALVLTGSLLRSVARDVDTAARIDDRTFALLMDGPVRPAQAISAATAILAGGLRPHEQLPVGATLRYKIVIALLPDASIDLPMDAQQHLSWLHDEVDNLQWDRQRNIATVNF
ncbi:MAG: 7TM diverse intracellular signaling domain-containing protein, partial [Gammaproteobacteria bacterium]